MPRNGRGFTEQAARTPQQHQRDQHANQHHLQRSGARLGESQHRTDNARIFSFALDDEDRALLQQAFAATRTIAGDCGDEYRRPPFLTASGDLSHHLASLPQAWRQQARIGGFPIDR